MEERTTVIIPLWMKKLVVKSKMNLSYFVREKLYEHFKQYPVPIQNKKPERDET